MSLSAIRAQVKTVIEGADTVSRVHDYERWTNDPASLLTLFKPAAGDAHLRAWIFKPVTIQERRLTMRETLVSYVFLVRYVHSLKDADATEKTATDTIEAVRAAFRANDTLNGTAFTCTPIDGPLQGLAGLQLDKLDLITLGGVLCHYGELRLAAQEIVAL